MAKPNTPAPTAVTPTRNNPMPHARTPPLLTIALIALALIAFPLAGCETQEKQTGAIPHKKVDIKKSGDNRYQRNADSDEDPATTDFLR